MVVAKLDTISYYRCQISFDTGAMCAVNMKWVSEWPGVAPLLGYLRLTSSLSNVSNHL